MTAKKAKAPKATQAEIDCRLDVVFGEAYKQVADEVDQVAVLNDLLAGVADALELPFIGLEHKESDGRLGFVAASGTGALYKEWLRTPEHLDDSALGGGPAAQAMRTGEEINMAVDDEGFYAWKKAASKDRIVAVVALPMHFVSADKQKCWIAVFAYEDGHAISQPENADCLRNLVNRMADLCRVIHKQTQQQLVCSALRDAGNAAFITDTSGKILWANEAFSRLSGHPLEEIIGHNPSILKSGKQGFRYYNRLWRTISAGKVWSGETIDRDRQGELYTIRQTVSPIKDKDEVTHYVSIHEDISSEKAMQVARERARRVDEVTGLMTPATFEERYQRAVDFSLANGERMALLIVTVSEFDALMQSLGHDIEQLVLETLGDRIRSHLRDDDFASHTAAGDFSVVLRGIGSSEEARAIGEEIMEAIDEPFPLLGDRLYLTRSLGLALLPEDAGDADELVRVADARAGGQ